MSARKRAGGPFKKREPAPAEKLGERLSTGRTVNSRRETAMTGNPAPSRRRITRQRCSRRAQPHELGAATDTIKLHADSSRATTGVRSYHDGGEDEKKGLPGGNQHRVEVKRQSLPKLIKLAQGTRRPHRESTRKDARHV